MLEFEFVLFTSCTLSLQNQTLCLNSLKFLISIIFLIEVHDSEEKCLYIYVCVCVRMCVCVCARVCLDIKASVQMLLPVLMLTLVFLWCFSNVGLSYWQSSLCFFLLDMLKQAIWPANWFCPAFYWIGPWKWWKVKEEKERSV